MDGRLICQSINRKKQLIRLPGPHGINVIGTNMLNLYELNISKHKIKPNEMCLKFHTMLKHGYLFR